VISTHYVQGDIVAHIDQDYSLDLYSYFFWSSTIC